MGLFDNSISLRTLDEHVDILNNTFNKSIEAIDNMSSLATSLCGIFALLYIGNIIWKSWCSGGSINIYAIFKPFVYGLIIMNFNLFIDIVNGIGNIVLVQPTQTLIKNQNQKIDKYINSNINYILKEEVEKEEENKDFFDSLKDGWDDVSFPSSEDIGKAIMNYFNYGVNKIVGALGYLVGYIIVTISFILRLILYVLGPFAIALSILPNFSNVFNNWLSRYITIFLYIPCVNIITYIGSALLLDTFSDSSNADDYLAFSLVLAVSYICVPSIASFVTGSAGASSITSESRSIGKASKSTASKAAKVLGGKVAGGVEGLKSLVSK